jgi:hypothetical protein
MRGSGILRGVKSSERNALNVTPIVSVFGIIVDPH